MLEKKSFVYIESLIKQGESFSNKSLQAKLLCYRNVETSTLENTNKHVMFIDGKADIAVTITDILKQVHVPEISYFHTLNNIGHMGMWEAA